MHQSVNAPSLKRNALRAREDEDLAGRTSANLLITSSARARVETVARRIHGASARAGFPFVRTAAVDLSPSPHTLRNTCSDLLTAAAGGTVLISDVEEMPRAVQELLVDLLDELGTTRAPSARIRLMAGTTVSLLDRVAAGTFSERLYYRLNMIHLRAGRGSRSEPA